MAEQGSPGRAVRDGYLLELTEAALRVAARHGMRGFSVDQEIGFWKRLGEVLRRGTRNRGSDRSRQEALSAELAQAAYEMSLEQGFRGSFLDIQLDFWKALRQVTREGAWARSFWSLLCLDSEDVRSQERRTQLVAVA